MDQPQYSIHQILQNKRDLLRETIRNNDLEKIFQQKRIQTQQNQESEEISILSSSSSINYRKNQSIIEIESSSEEASLIRLTKIRIKANLTPNYLISVNEYLKRDPYIFQVQKIFTLCEDAILDIKLTSSDLVPYLVEIIYSVAKYKTQIPFKPLTLLLQAFTLHQDYIILQYIKMYLQNNKQETSEIDQFCKQKSLFQDESFLFIICNNIKYANLQMLLFLCETIKNNDFIQAIQVYGVKIFDKNIEYKKEYRKIIKEIQILAEIRLSNKEILYQN
ncbi:unnamed protein product [Paramecium pentaurelia]|uniref:Uncharacterized protein n=1 Tax=Paramecium pentaurelia TaxID=43138 RepID=A0A8S1S4W2_9CILI|nr:unnamed protein product [Paramecium pentaurelia]